MEKNNEQDLVSIIIPVYNASKFLNDTLNTILNQTYTNFEALFVNDCSSDNSADIILKCSDERVKLINNEKNSGAAVSRNNGIKNAKGRFICFLDSDDLWEVNKIEEQVKFMKENNSTFSYTSYEFADENGKPNGKKVYVPENITYKQALKNTTIWTSTVMFDMDKLTKDNIYMPDVRRGQDTATWWKVLKTIDHADGLNKVLSYYRRSSNSLSANKIKALKRTWNLYRNVEHLNIVYSLYNFIWYCFNAVKRRV